MYYIIAFLVGSVVGSLVVFFVTMNNLKLATAAKEKAEMALKVSIDELNKFRSK